MLEDMHEPGNEETCNPYAEGRMLLWGQRAAIEDFIQDIDRA